VASETGNNNYTSVVVSGPLSDNIGGKLAAYYNKDDGWFTNLFNGEDFGKAETMMYRGALDFEFTDTMDLIVRFEHADSDGDGPPAQNDGLYSRDSFDFSINYNGYYDSSWDQAIAEFTWDVGPGDGQIVNILGRREYSSLTGGDIDASPASIFHSAASTDQDQLSNELRYGASVGNSYLTMGLYYFTQDISYVEQRDLFGSVFGTPIVRIGGGTQKQDTVAFFANVDVDLTDQITLNLGARYTEDTKDGEVTTILASSDCTVGVGCNNIDFSESRTWNSLSPKIGVQIEISEYTHTYAFWTKGFRSGGYNLRHTAINIPSESFDQEVQDSYEIGVKKDFAGGRVRVNVAGYYNTMSDLQRELNLADPAVGVIQLIRNTSDATITGFDFEMSASLSDTLFLKAVYGYVDGGYDEVRFDLNSDGVIDSNDQNLALPRLAPHSYGAELIYSRDTGIGTFTAQLNGYHRDASAYTDNNFGQLRAADMLYEKSSVSP
jgi:iron complex outermembrane receptor protein